MKIIKVIPRQLTAWEVKEKARLLKDNKPVVSRTHSAKIADGWYKIWRV